MSQDEREVGHGKCQTADVISHPRRQAIMRERLASLQAVLASQKRAAIEIIERTQRELASARDEPLQGVTDVLLSALDDTRCVLDALEPDAPTIDPARFQEISARLGLLANYYSPEAAVALKSGGASGANGALAPTSPDEPAVGPDQGKTSIALCPRRS